MGTAWSDEEALVEYEACLSAAGPGAPAKKQFLDVLREAAGNATGDISLIPTGPTGPVSSDVEDDLFEDAMLEFDNDMKLLYEVEVNKIEVDQVLTVEPVTVVIDLDKNEV